MSENYKVLWIDDEAAVLNSILNPIRREGVHIDEIDNKADAIALSDISMYDLIILDILLPEEKGSPYGGNFLEDILSHIRETLDSDIPIIVLSILNKKEHQEILNRHNVEEFIHKPSEIDDITSSVLEILKRTG